MPILATRRELKAVGDAGGVVMLASLSAPNRVATEVAAFFTARTA
ncbi:hypothetical protein [Metapseudomonas otitidis]|nr:hypothetical protein [Pseudomonas otitidis]